MYKVVEARALNSIVRAFKKPFPLKNTIVFVGKIVRHLFYTRQLLYLLGHLPSTKLSSLSNKVAKGFS